MYLVDGQGVPRLAIIAPCHERRSIDALSPRDLALRHLRGSGRPADRGSLALLGRWKWKGRLVWEKAPFLTHPGAGSGWVLVRTRQLCGNFGAKMKRRREMQSRLLPHMQPRARLAPKIRKKPVKSFICGRQYGRCDQV